MLCYKELPLLFSVIIEWVQKPFTRLVMNAILQDLDIICHSEIYRNIEWNVQERLILGLCITSIPKRRLTVYRQPGYMPTIYKCTRKQTHSHDKPSGCTQHWGTVRLMHCTNSPSLVSRHSDAALFSTTKDIQTMCTCPTRSTKTL